jgi:hypothetical protein
MNAYPVLLRCAGECGWGDETMLAVVCEYVDNQCNADAFAEFAAQKAAEETEISSAK